MFRFICFLVFVCLFIIENNAIQSKLPSVIAIRGGASKSKASRKTSSSKSSSKGKKSSRFDDDDDDFDDEDDEPIKKSKAKVSSKKSSSLSGKSKSKSGKSKGRMDLVPVKSKKGKRKSSSSFPGLPVNLNIQEKLSDITKQSQSIYKDMYRRAKVLRSSPFEGMLLKATWPGTEPISPEILNEIVRHSIPAFKYGSSSNSEDDPYHMTLHKLWTKMTEKDWRVVIKATFILHCVSRDSSVDTCEKFASAIKSMSRTRNPKKPTHKYFDLQLIDDLDINSEIYQDFVVQYAKYVLYRAKTFSGKFEELKRIEDTEKIKIVVAQLKKAKQCITLGLGCALSGKEFVKPVLGQCVKTLSMDLRDIWKLFSSKISILLAYEPEVTPSATIATVGVSDLTPSSATATKADSTTAATANPLDKDVVELLEFYKSTESKISEFLQKSSKMYSKLKIKIPSEVDPSEVESEKVSDKISKLTTLRGGARDDDDDEDEDEDDDEDEDEDTNESNEDGDDEDDDDASVKSSKRGNDDDDDDDDSDNDDLEKELDPIKDDEDDDADDDDNDDEDGDGDDADDDDDDDEDE